MVLLYDRIVGGPHATKVNGVRIIIITKPEAPYKRLIKPNINIKEQKDKKG